MNDYINYDGDIEAEAEIVKIALCRKYQDLYSDIETACRNAGLFPIDAETIKKWKYHGIGNPADEYNALYYYFKESERERFDKSVFIYNRER